MSLNYSNTRGTNSKSKGIINIKFLDIIFICL